MRVNRLDLTRYGRFTDASLDFGRRPDAGPDLHVVYGPNEAGKSTVFAAMLDLFYGIEPRSTYNFLHPYPQMRVGASLLIDGVERAYVRVKRQQGSLLDAAGAAVSEAALQGALGGLTREACRVMFSLDDETLEEGGESILASRGDLGQLLFSASAGLASLSRTLQKLEEELDAFHTPRAQKSRLAELKRRLAELGEARKAVDMQAGAYAGLVAAEQQTAAAYDDARARLAEATVRRARLAAALKSLPLRRERDSIMRDEPALSVAAAVDALRDAAAEIRKERRDLPNRRAECAAADDEVAALLRKLGREEEAHPTALLLQVDQAAAVRELAGRSGAVDATLAAARQAVAEADAAVADLRAGAGAEPPDPAVIHRLRTALAETRAERATGQLRDAERRSADAAARLAEALAALRPWTGDAEALAALDAPEPADVLAAGIAIAECEKQLALRAAAAERASAELARHRAVRVAAGGAATPDGGIDHAAIRVARDRSWSAHRRRLDEASADAFEEALRRDDASAAARLVEAAATARLGDLRAAEAAASAEFEQTTAARDAAAAALSEARAKLSALAEVVSPHLSAEAFSAWLKRRDDALRAAREARSAGCDVEAARAALLEARGRLAEALAAAGSPPAGTATLTLMEQSADMLLQDAGKLQERAAAEARSALVLKARRETLASAEAAAEGWRSDWDDRLAACWLGALAPPPSPSAVLDVLDTLSRLETAVARRAWTHDRLAKIERDVQAFAGDVTGLAVSLGVRQVADDALAAFDGVAARVAAARASEDRAREIAGLLAALAADAGEVDAEAGDELLARRLAESDAEIEHLKAAELAAFHRRETARSALAAVGGDAKAALIEAERATLLAEIRAESERYLRLRLGGLAIRQAIRLYRDRHRSSMLEAASEAFRVVSRGAYRGLSTQTDGGQERLIAIAADGASKEATEAALSKGTRFQLYLALRVAGHREFARERTPPPFVLDDVMETFDDFRTEEAFRLLAAMAEHGQVICLTHHRHVADTALRICSSVRIHTL
jgi:uncharacterized protein YhaN